MEILHSRKANQYRVSEEKELGDLWDWKCRVGN